MTGAARGAPRVAPDGLGLISTPEELRLPPDVGAVAFDFDGVFTDNGVWVDAEGREIVRCDRSDGLGVQIMMRAGVPATVISKTPGGIVRARCERLGVPAMDGVDDKPPRLLAWLEGLHGGRGVAPERAVYVGNDTNDLGCFGVVGCALAPADSHPAALAAATSVLKRPGGRGAVREVCDAVLARIA